MIDPNSQAGLEEIVRRESRSLLSYVGDSFPWTTAQGGPALARLQEAVRGSKEAVADLGVGVAGVSAAVLGPSGAKAQAGPARRIDVHHHFMPPFHREVLIANRGGAVPPAWTVEGSLQDMDKAGVATAMLSIMQPGIWFGND